mgnify:CR=1 FL=1
MGGATGLIVSACGDGGYGPLIMTGTYAAVLVVEALIILALYFVGRLYS